MKQSPLRITVIGGGAAGLEFARLAPHAEVTFLFREGDRYYAVRDNGATIKAHPSDPEGDKHFPSHQQPRSLPDIPGQSNLSILLAEGPVPRINVLADVENINLPQDYVFIATKAPDSASIIKDTLPVLAKKNPNIKVVLAHNGIPIQINRGREELRKKTLPSIDPDKEIKKALDDYDVITLVYNRITNYMPEPGVVVNACPPPAKDPRLILGKLSGRQDDSIDELAVILNASGLSTVVADNIRAPLFYKLMLNIGGAVSAATGESLGEVFADRHAPAAQVARLAIEETRYAARTHYGIELPPAAQFIDIMASLGEYKPTICRDIEEGKTVTERKYFLDAVADIRGWQEGVESPALTELSRILGSLEEANKTSNPAVACAEIRSTLPQQFQNIIQACASIEPSVPLTMVGGASNVSKKPSLQDTKLVASIKLLLKQYEIDGGNSIFDTDDHSCNEPLSDSDDSITHKLRRNRSRTRLLDGTTLSFDSAASSPGEAFIESHLKQNTETTNISTLWDFYNPEITKYSTPDYNGVHIWLNNIENNGSAQRAVHKASERIIESICSDNPSLKKTIHLRNHRNYISLQHPDAEAIITAWHNKHLDSFPDIKQETAQLKLSRSRDALTALLGDASRK